MMAKKVVLHFPHSLLGKPVMCKLITDYSLVFNILKAYIPSEEDGLLVLELWGEDEQYLQGLRYLKKAGVRVQPFTFGIIRDEEKCIHCSLCVPICPTGALEIKEKSREVIFDTAKCISCNLCASVCPVKAFEQNAVFLAG